jgi:hypothetical protein
MRERRLAAALLALFITAIPPAANAEENSELAGYKRIRGSAIQRLISGKELSDGVHWRYSFQPNGQLVEFAMSRRHDLRWRTNADELCWTSAGREECYEVWSSIKGVRLLPTQNGMPLDGQVSRSVP